MPNSRQEDGGGLLQNPGGRWLDEMRSVGASGSFFVSFVHRAVAVPAGVEMSAVGQERKSKSRVCPFFERGYREQISSWVARSHHNFSDVV